jgi:hypothetical protein
MILIEKTVMHITGGVKVSMTLVVTNEAEKELASLCVAYSSGSQPG